MSTSFSFSSRPAAPKKVQRIVSFQKVVPYVGVAFVSLAGGLLIGGAFTNRAVAKDVPVTVSKVAEINQLIQKVSHHIVVDTKENPTVATVEDAAALRAQSALFYRDAAPGDKLLLWNDRAVLYSPSRDKVLAAMVLEGVGQTPTQPSAPVSATSPAVVPKTVTFELRNGSGVVGATKTLKDSLTLAGYTVEGAHGASDVYTGIIIVPMTAAGNAVDQTALSTLVHGNYEPLPPKESTSQADVLVIIGK